MGYVVPSISLNLIFGQDIIRLEYNHWTFPKLHLGLMKGTEFLVMPFGLTNTPSTFQSLMNEVFRAYLRDFILVFFYDILVYSSSWEKHLQHLEQTLQLLHKHQLYAKKSVCVFAKPEVDYLGLMVSDKGASAEASKISAMISCLVPSTIKELRGFLGLTGY